MIRTLLPDPARDFVYEYIMKAARNGQLGSGDDDVPDTPNRYADPFTESLLKILLPRISAETGVSLFPTYSYFRVYKRGDVLKAHRDRPSCEISATLSLGYDADAPWPIWVESVDEAKAIALEPGDGMLYRGTEIPHWRESFSGTHAAQVFLHYVDQHGPHRNWKFDKRPALSTSPAMERLLETVMRGNLPITPSTGERRS